ncbi:MAG: DUF4282 domain-containing protein [Francisella sp.]
MEQNNIENQVENKVGNVVLNFLKKFISFDNMITPNLIVVIFWIMFVGILFKGLAVMLSAFSHGNSFLLFFYGIFQIFIGVLIVKVFCEILVVLFKINDSLKEIVQNTKNNK